jgi:hypothetical protein
MPTCADEASLYRRRRRRALLWLTYADVYWRMMTYADVRRNTYVLFNLERSHDSIFIENREVVL